jgi:hypothetical protein
MMTDLIAGHLDVGWASPESALSQMGSGRLRIIGVTSRERLPLLSDVPSISEADLPDFEFTGWVGLYAPAGLPAAIARRMNAALRAAVTQQEVRRRIIQMGNYDFVEDAEAFAAPDAQGRRALEQGGARGTAGIGRLRSADDARAGMCASVAHVGYGSCRSHVGGREAELDTVAGERGVGASGHGGTKGLQEGGCRDARCAADHLDEWSTSKRGRRQERSRACPR